jgi:type IV pilus assembly protein PilY1
LNIQNQQHLVTLGVALGLEGSLRPPKEQAFNARLNGTESELNWPNPIASTGDARLLDLLHASANGRGDFFNAQNPIEFARALTSSLVTIADLATSNTPRAVSSARLASDTLIYEASYESGNWAGKLKAYTPNETALGLEYVEQWEAGEKLASSSRKFIYGSSTGTAKGVAMTWGNVNQAFFNNDQDLFKYITGNRLDEDPNGRAFRARDSLLGDIVNSSVVSVSRRDFGYLPSRTGLVGYEAFLKEKKARNPVVFAGANDGFLHGFDGVNGSELFAFMPYGVAANVKSLADKNYQHRYFVDGKIHEHDVLISTPGDAAKKWRTVLVGGLGAGGKSVYALDVTNASSFGPKNVLWEFSDADMGYSFGEPVVGLLANGSWGAIFGNGYGTKSNGTPLDSVLYVVNLETGALIDKKVLATGTGGLASPGYVYSPSGDSKKFAVASIYVGELGGNLWKLDAKNNGTFTTAFGGAPLFKAVHGSGASAKPQPITVRPRVAAHPKVTDTHMVYFGTGSFASYADISSERINEVQSVYGIWGNGVPSGNNKFSAINSRSALEQVKITAEYSSGGYDSLNPDLKSDMRLIEEKDEIDWTNKGGWYLDLLTKGITAEGERVVSQPEIIRKSLVFKTNLPSKDPCLPDDNGWLMAMDLETGGRLSYTVWDYNRDGVVDDKDDLLLIEDGDGAKGTGIRGDGILPTGGLLIGDSKCYYYGMVVNCDTRPTSGRVSWEQIDEE